MTSPIIKVDGVEQHNVAQFAPILENFLSAYEQKPDDVSFEDWLSERLQDQLSDLAMHEAQALATELIDGVDSFQADLQRLNVAIDEGQTKEAWLAEQIARAADNAAIDSQILGHHLYQIERVMTESNQVLFDAFQSKSGGIIKIHPDLILENPLSEWNKLNTAAVAFDIAKQAQINGLGNTAVSAGLNLALGYANGDDISKFSTLKKALTDSKDDEIKKTAAAALKVAIDKGIFPTVPQDLPANSIGELTAFGVENSKILYSLGSGVIPSLRAIDLTARNYVALISGFSGQKIGAALGASMFSFIPVVGTALGSLVGGLIGRFVDNKLTQTIRQGAEHIKTAAESFAKSAWNVVKSRFKSTVSTVTAPVRAVGRAVASFFGF